MNKEENNNPNLRLKKQIIDLLKAKNISIEEYLEEIKQEKKEKFDKEIEDYLLENPTLPTLIDSIDITDNTENLGYKKQFFNRTDAEFLVKQIADWEEEYSLVEIDPFLEDEKEKMIQTYLATGVRYDFKNIGITLYYLPLFYQTNYNDGRSMLNYGTSFYKYDHFKNEFFVIDNDDFHEITFS